MRRIDGKHQRITYIVVVLVEVEVVMVSSY
jgi:hypothetical protein